MEEGREKTFVSVILPTYNEERYIRSCIESLVDQTYPRELMEWIIIDGDSTDGTKGIIQDYLHSYPIKLINNKNRRTPISLNLGIEASRGDIIVRFDAHSSFPSDYIEKCVRCIHTTGADNVGGWVETKAEGFIGNSIAKILSSRFGVGGSSFRTEHKSGYVDTVPFGAFKRSVFTEVGLFNEQLLRSEDNDINARIIECGGRVYISEEIHSVYYCRDKISTFLKQGIQNGNALFRTIKLNPKAMKIRHFVPFGFLISLLVLPIIGVFVPLIKDLFIFELVSYSFIDFYYSFIKRKRILGIVTIWLYPLFHIFYGIGSLLGLLGVEMY